MSAEAQQRTTECFGPGAPEPLFRPLSPAASLPLDALPAIIRAGVEGVHGRTQSPRALCLNSVMSVAALVAAREIEVRLHTGQPRPACLYMVTVAGTGERKTSSDTEACVAIGEWEERAREAYLAAAEENRIDLDVWEEQAKAAKKKNKSAEIQRAALKELGPQPTAPLKPEVLSDEPTMEGLWLQLKEGCGFVGVFNAEGGQFIGGHAMSKDNKLTSAGKLNELWDGKPWRRTRRGDGVTALNHRRVCMHLMVQPRAAMSFLSDPVLLDNGFTTRLLVAAPESAMGTRFGSRTPESEQQYAAWCAESRMWWRREVKHCKPGDGALELRTLELADGAREAAEAFALHVEKNLKEDGAYAPIGGFGNKLAEHATRIAAVFAYAENPDCGQVSADNMRRGIALAEWYASEALRLREAGALSPELLLADKVRRWIVEEWASGKITGRPEDYVSLPDLYQRGPAAVRCAKGARAAADTLATHRYLARADGSVVIDGKRRREAWRINIEEAA